MKRIVLLNRGLRCWLCSTPRARNLPLAAAMLLLLLSARSTTFAGSALWQPAPLTGDWNTATNWVPVTVPNGSADTATFALSTTTGVLISANTEVNGITFNAAASAFTITASPAFTLTISGVGITNSSGITQNFAAAGDAGAGKVGLILFKNSATAGSTTVFNNNGGAANGAAGGDTEFSNTSTAGSATINNNGGTVLAASGGDTEFSNTSTAGSATINNNAGTTFIATGGHTQFSNTSTAGSATINNNGGTVVGAQGGATMFGDSSTAGSATINNNGGANENWTSFFGNSTAGSATLIANSSTRFGGEILFLQTSTGGTARVEVFGNGFLDISQHNAPGVSIGSIEGTGNVFLGANNLTVGSNNLSTTFSGVMQDGGGVAGTGGSLTKSGTGTLTLSGANTYTGGTIVSAGTLLVNNTSGSGAVQVNAGTLGGTGTIAGAVTVGTGSGPGAVLSPGQSPGTLTIQSALTLNSDATYKFELNSSTATADKVVANGVTIGAGAQFSFIDLGNGTLAVGSSFTAIDNTAASAISGTFSNLADGSMFTANGNTFLVSYEGGDGNDLTIEAVPEPSTWGAGLLTAGTLLCSIWRRRAGWLRRRTHAC